MVNFPYLDPSKNMLLKWLNSELRCSFFDLERWRILYLSREINEIMCSFTARSSTSLPVRVSALFLCSLGNMQSRLRDSCFSAGRVSGFRRHQLNLAAAVRSFELKLEFNGRHFVAGGFFLRGSGAGGRARRATSAAGPRAVSVSLACCRLQ